MYGTIPVKGILWVKKPHPHPHPHVGSGDPFHKDVCYSGVPSRRQVEALGMRTCAERRNGCMTSQMLLHFVPNKKEIKSIFFNTDDRRR